MNTLTIIRKYSYLLTLCLSCIYLTACFVPNKYIATLSLSEDAYTFEFIGEMRMMYMYDTSLSNDAGIDMEKAAEQVLSEFKRLMQERKPHIFELRKKTATIFQTKFSYTSPYEFPEVTGLFHIHKQGNVLTLTSRRISKEEHNILKKDNIPSKGVLCVKSFGKILQSNAHSPSNILQQCSTWKLENLDEGIKMIIHFQGDAD